jgi:preprotein translocase subunit SecG
MLTILLTVLHVIVALILILVVLLQTGKRADLAGAFGGGGSQTVFGTRGAATFLSKLTTTAAVLFMLTSLGLSIVSSRGRGPAGTVIPDDEPTTQGAPAPLPTDPAPGTTPALPPDEGGVTEEVPAEEPAGADESVPE